MANKLYFDIRLSTGPWSVWFGRFAGIACSGANCIVVCPGKENIDRLDTFVHETLHASCPKLSEQEVIRIAGDVAGVLWAAGYRKPSQQKPTAGQCSGTEPGAP